MSCCILSGSVKPLALGLVLAAGAALTGAFTMGMGERPAAVAAAVAAQATDTNAFTVDQVHSSVIFRCVRNNGAPFYGRFNQISGSFSINHEDPSKSFINVKIPVASVDSNNKGRDDHLKNADFFSAGEYPDATFVSKSFKKTGDKAYEVTGDLTVRGTTKPATLTVKETGQGPARGGKTSAGYDVTFSFKRSDFGISYGLQALSDEIQMMIGLEGTR